MTKTIWVLILIFQGGNPATFNYIDFNSLSACQAAGNSIDKNAGFFTVSGNFYPSMCVNRDTGQTYFFK